jgi:D-galactarolactone cycloisomerase
MALPMKITAISTYLIGIPFETGAPTAKLAGQTWSRMAILMVRVDTDEGVSGWGEGFGHAVAPATKRALDTLIAPPFIGRDPRDIERLMAEMFQKLHLFGRNGPVTYGLSAIDIALWDIAGKVAGVPLHRLLGGGRRELTAYASLLRYEKPDIVARIAEQAVSKGYRFIKLHEVELAPVQAAREAIGRDVALMCDTNCPWPVERAIEMARAFEPLKLHWLEEPVWPPENHRGLARVRAAGTPIAAGENAAGLAEFRSMFDVGAIDIAQPSVTKIGGISRMRDVISLAGEFGVRVVPHCAYFGPGYLASLHLVALLAPNTPFERLYVEFEARPFGAWLSARSGTVAVPNAPGLGCDPDMALLERYASEPVTTTR